MKKTNLSKEEIASNERIETLKLVLVRAMEGIIAGAENYTYAEINTVLVDLLSHNLGEELKGQLGNQEDFK